MSNSAMDIDDIDDEITVKLEPNEEGSMEGSNGDSDDDKEGLPEPPKLFSIATMSAGT